MSNKHIEEKHVIYSRSARKPDAKMFPKPRRMADSGTYLMAVKFGMEHCGFGHYFVESYKKTETATNWTLFSPEPVTLQEVRAA